MSRPKDMKISKIDKKDSKKNSKKVTKGKSKSTKSKIEKLNKSIEIDQFLLNNHGEKSLLVLDVKKLKQDLSTEKKRQQDDKKVENDISQQLELITGMGL